MRGEEAEAAEAEAEAEGKAAAALQTAAALQQLSVSVQLLGAMSDASPVVRTELLAAISLQVSLLWLYLL